MKPFLRQVSRIFLGTAWQTSVDYRLWSHDRTYTHHGGINSARLLKETEGPRIYGRNELENKTIYAVYSIPSILTCSQYARSHARTRARVMNPHKSVEITEKMAGEGIAPTLLTSDMHHRACQPEPWILTGQYGAYMKTERNHVIIYLIIRFQLI